MLEVLGLTLALTTWPGWVSHLHHPASCFCTRDDTHISVWSLSLFPESQTASPAITLVSLPVGSLPFQGLTLASISPQVRSCIPIAQEYLIFWDL